MKKYASILLVLLFVAFTATDSYSQRRSSKRTSSRTENSRSSRNDDTPSLSLRDKLAYDIYLGNIGFSQGFNITMKGGAGYKVSERFTVGLGTKFYYQYLNRVGSSADESFFSYGGYVYPRFRISEQIYIKGEYNFLNIDGGNGDDAQAWIPMLGGGYASGFGPWKFGLELLVIIQDEDRDLYGGDLFEYMFSALYNF